MAMRSDRLACVLTILVTGSVLADDVEVRDRDYCFDAIASARLSVCTYYDSRFSGRVTISTWDDSLELVKKAPVDQGLEGDVFDPYESDRPDTTQSPL